MYKTVQHRNFSVLALYIVLDQPSASRIHHPDPISQSTVRKQRPKSVSSIQPGCVGNIRQIVNVLPTLHIIAPINVPSLLFSTPLFAIFDLHSIRYFTLPGLGIPRLARQGPLSHLNSVLSLGAVGGHPLTLLTSPNNSKFEVSPLLIVAIALPPPGIAHRFGQADLNLQRTCVACAPYSLRCSTHSTRFISGRNPLPRTEWITSCLMLQF